MEVSLDTSYPYTCIYADYSSQLINSSDVYSIKIFANYNYITSTISLNTRFDLSNLEIMNNYNRGYNKKYKNRCETVRLNIGIPINTEKILTDTIHFNKGIWHIKIFFTLENNTEGTLKFIVNFKNSNNVIIQSKELYYGKLTVGIAHSLYIDDTLVINNNNTYITPYINTIIGGGGNNLCNNKIDILNSYEIIRIN